MPDPRERPLQIGAVAAAARVTPDAVRYYERLVRSMRARAEAAGAAPQGRRGADAAAAGGFASWAGKPFDELSVGAPALNVGRVEARLFERRRAGDELAFGARQATVVTLHDIDGVDPTEVCNVLAIRRTNQRVLLHRAHAECAGRRSCTRSGPGC